MRRLILEMLLILGLKQEPLPSEVLMFWVNFVGCCCILLAKC